MTANRVGIRRALNSESMPERRSADHVPTREIFSSEKGHFLGVASKVGQLHKWTHSREMTFGRAYAFRTPSSYARVPIPLNTR